MPRPKRKASGAPQFTHHQQHQQPRAYSTTRLMDSTDDSSSTTTTSAPTALATEGDWAAYLDQDTTGLVYYFNGRTGESLWEPPTDTFPPVVLPRKMRRQAETQRSQYIKSLRATREEKQQFPKVVEDVVAAASEAAQQQEADGSVEASAKSENWYDFLFEEEPEPEAEPEPEPTLFDKVFAKDDQSESTAVATASEEETSVKESAASSQEEEESAPSRGFFGRFFGRRKAAEEKEETIEDPFADFDNEAEQVKESVEMGDIFLEPVSKTFSIFQNFIQEVSTSSSKVSTTDEDADDSVEEPTKTKEPEPKTQTKSRFTSIPTKQENDASKTNFAPTARSKPSVEKEEKKLIVPEPETQPIKIETATCVLPHPAKMFWGGEDAVFVSGRTFGVFDGVSGARKLDGVPLYSKTLASEMKKVIKEQYSLEDGLNMMELQKSLGSCKAIADESSTGASTAIVASITQDGFLRALNVGDSAMLVIRDGKVVARTREISHYFDCPYQFSTDSPDKPRDGTKLNIELVKGDVIGAYIKSSWRFESSV